MKKGSFELAGEQMLWIGSRLIITLIVMLVAFSVIALALNRDINVKDAEADLVMRKLYYSSDCFAFEDNNVHLGVIDLSKFNEERLESCFSKSYAIKVELKELNKIISTKFHSSEFDLCSVQNEKNKCSFTTQQYVLVNENGKIKQGEMLKVNIILR
tara:strand:- start:836 stop:1306 length:471 start_codon:yes stop_codon:yes gene_type:complete